MAFSKDAVAHFPDNPDDFNNPKTLIILMVLMAHNPKKPCNLNSTFNLNNLNNSHTGKFCCKSS